MFGQTTASNGSHPPSNRPAAANVALIDTLYTHVLVSPDKTDGLQVFQNARPLSPGSLESLSITINAPDSDGRGGGITGLLSRYANGGESIPGISSSPTQESSALFPGTVEIVARGRRIIVTCQDEDSFEGLWLGLGMRADGTAAELMGVQSLRIVVTPSLLDARLVWSEDGSEEDLLPEA